MNRFRYLLLGILHEKKKRHNNKPQTIKTKIGIGLYQQKNNFVRASRFFVHFLAVVARLQRESA